METKIPASSTALVPAAGRGQRFGSGENKVWAAAAGRPLLWWSASALDAHLRIDSVIVVTAPGEGARAREILSQFSKVHVIEKGGGSRAESVLNGLRESGSSKMIVVHDAARPNLSADLITRVLDAALVSGAAIPGIPISDTLKRVNSEGSVAENVSRDGLYAVQTPQCARVDILMTAYERLGASALSMTDEASILTAGGYPVQVVPGDADNLKITTQEDLAKMERILLARSQSNSRVRTGFGYDVHPFADGRALWLGGVRIPHAQGLAGHSDADVLIHAVCDALLGAAGMGDIGLLFSDEDAANKDRPSLDFLQDVARRIQTEGWNVSNIDVTLLAETPRIRPYCRQISALLAGCLRAEPAQINIKATTSEGMGFVGRREGIACWAVATLVSETTS